MASPAIFQKVRRLPCSCPIATQRIASHRPRQCWASRLRLLGSPRSRDELTKIGAARLIRGPPHTPAQPHKPIYRHGCLAPFIHSSKLFVGSPTAGAVSSCRGGARAPGLADRVWLVLARPTRPRKGL